MKHYDHIEWILYKKKLFPEEKMLKMEEHLYSCDRCLETFLSLVDNEEIDKANKDLSIDFTDQIMAKIENIYHMPKPKNNKANKKYREIFIYYTAVAAVTLVLTMGGIFTRLVDTLPQVAQSTTTVEAIEIPNIVADVSGRIVNKTADFINNFEVTNIEEDENEREK